jgi:hypothetical protein
MSMVENNSKEYKELENKIMNYLNNKKQLYY